MVKDRNFQLHTITVFNIFFFGVKYQFLTFPTKPSGSVPFHMMKRGRQEEGKTKGKCHLRVSFVRTTKGREPLTELGRRRRRVEAERCSFKRLLFGVMDPPPQRVVESRLPPGRALGDSSAIITVMIAFVSMAALILVPSSISATNNSFSILHQVPEGHVGVYWRGGALLKTITYPGFHLKLPLITQFEPIQVTLQKDQVKDIPCGTKGGVMISFDKIEVVNRLHKDYVYETLLNYGVEYDHTWIYDKIHHEVNQFCSAHSLQQVYIDMFDQIDEKLKDALQGDCTRYAPGIEIISVRVTKPKIPDSIRRNFEQMEEERTKVLIAIEKQRVAEKEAETQKKMALTEAEKNAQVSRILMEQKLMEKDSARMQQEIENQMYMDRQKSLADADFYRSMQEAEANKLKLTPEFLELKFIEAITNNSKIFFGDKVPSMVFDQRLLGNFLNDISRKRSSDL